MSQAAAYRRSAGEAGPSGSRAVPAHNALERMAFTQAVMQRRFLPDVEARGLYRTVRAVASDDGYLEILADANKYLACVHFELRRIKYLFDDLWYLALVNKQVDKVAESSGSPYTFPQVQLLRFMLEEIALDPDAEEGKGSIGSTAALNMNFTQTQAQTQAQTQGTQGAPQPKKLTMAERRALLDSFVGDGWLAPTPGSVGRYSIGPRAFLELHEFLLSLDLPDATRAAWGRFL